MHHSFPKQERLSKKSDIDNLFAVGQSFMEYPVRCIYCTSKVGEAPPQVSVLVSVGKKYRKKAVDRNRIKRLLRESYRLSKHLLTGELPEGMVLHAAFLYISQKGATYSTIDECVKRSIEKIKQGIKNGLD